MMIGATKPGLAGEPSAGANHNRACYHDKAEGSLRACPSAAEQSAIEALFQRSMNQCTFALPPVGDEAVDLAQGCSCGCIIARR
jgi:hypothetical protein